jgi:primary-amine oxidase
VSIYLDYGFYWYFYLDGHIELEVKLTGILSVSAVKTGQNPVGYGTILGENLYGPIHQVFI